MNIENMQTEPISASVFQMNKLYKADRKKKIDTAASIFATTSADINSLFNTSVKYIAFSLCTIISQNKHLRQKRW